MYDRNYYAILGVDRSSSQEELTRAFRRLARQRHPDLRPDDPEADARFKEINEAYQILSDPERRANYDLELATSQSDWRSASLSESDGRMIVRQHSVVIHSDDLDEALRDLSGALGNTASIVADQLRGALRDFGSQIDRIAQDAQSRQANHVQRQSFPPPYRRPNPPPRGRPPSGGTPKR